ncbi:MAG: riboflavin kinase, partial [Luteibaculum sp.]
SLEFGFQVEEIPAQEVDDINVSSTKIRRALLQGDIKTAQQFLSYPYFLNARVIKGEGIGNTLGYPTANLLVEEPYKLIPKNGVYAVNVSIDGEKHPAMMNIGVRPTVSTGEKQSLEVHILDFSQDIYDQEIRVEFLEFIREEKKFESVEGLKKQLEHDKNYCLRFFSSV